MKKYLAILAACSLSSAAIAADLPVKSAPMLAPIPYAQSWTGFYVGISGGYGATSKDLSISGPDAVSAAILSRGLAPLSIETSSGGGLFGGQVGYNWQFGSFVVGPEADIYWSGISKTSSVATPVPGLRVPVSVNVTGTQDVNYLGSLRLRAGYLVVPRLLVYATGGLGYGDVKSSFSGSLVANGATLATAAFSNSGVQWGWTVGGGAEYAINDHWSAKVEYKYFDLSGISSNAPVLSATGSPILVGGTPVSFNGSQDVKINTVTVGVNYKF